MNAGIWEHVVITTMKSDRPRNMSYSKTKYVPPKCDIYPVRLIFSDVDAFPDFNN